MSGEKDLVQLKELLNRTVNAREAYKNASKNVHNQPLTVFFEKAAYQHELFSSRIKEEISKQGGEADENASLKSEVDRFWLDFASMIIRRNEHAILKACASTEEEAIRQYNEVLKTEISESLKNDVEQQRDYAVSLLKEVEEMKKEYPSD